MKRDLLRKVLAVAAVTGLAAWMSAHWSSPTRGDEPAGPAATVPVERLSVVAATPVEAGRYLVRIAGCNDCHTPGYMQEGEKIPESQWLTGLPVGFRGPWGTTYPSNLRLFAKTYNADTWVQVLRARNARPPMPWASLHAMSDADLRAIFEYIKSLPVAGNPTPEFVPPNQEPKSPFFVFVPQMPGGGDATPPATGAAAPPVVQPSK